MSRGRYLMLWTIVADLTGLILSYVYGALLPAWIGSLLPGWAGLVRTAAFWLYSRPILLLPYPIQLALLHHPGLFWLGLALLIHLYYLLWYLHRRAFKRDLGEPYSGDPGGPYWEMVQRRYKDYREAIQRWKPPFALKTPTFRYYKRRDSRQPDMFWRGDLLVIERDLLTPSRVQDLAPQLACQLMYYNSDDVVFMDVLSYYPDRFSRWQLFLHISGICIFLPALFMKWRIWPGYWEHRTLVADRFAYYLGQGHLVSSQLHGQQEQQEQMVQQRKDVSRQIRHLQNEINTEGYQDYSLTHYHGSYGWQTRRQQLDHQLNALQQRQLQLLAEEEQALSASPMLEQRLEQLASLLHTEQSWMEQRGVTTPALVPPLPLAQEPPRQLPSGTDQSNGTNQVHTSA